MGSLLKLTLIGVILAVIAERLVDFSNRLMYFREVQSIELSNCHLLEGIEYGSEDIDILPNGLAFISSGLNYPGVNTFAPDKPGQMLLLDLNDEELRPSPLRMSQGFDVTSFNPHGISTYIDEKSGVVYLFVVNHPLHPKYLRSIVEIFRFDEEENVLVHLKSVEHPLLHSVNDIVAVGPESFYATNDHYFSHLTMRALEFYSGFCWTDVVYYSPGDVRQVATGFSFANGIAISNDKKFLYVVALTSHTLNVFEKHSDWSLSPVKSVQLDTLLDNLWVDPATGDIWTAGHPNGYKVFFFNEDDVPGSEVLRIQNVHSDNPIVTTVYGNNGSVLQASSVAVLYKGTLLVGTVYHKALRCDWSDTTSTAKR